MKYIILLVYLLGNFSLCAEINVIPEREYFTTVQQLLAEAKNSIKVEMYLIHSNSLQVKGLLDSMTEARARGVKVSILLEDGEEENKLTAAYLRDRGVIARFDGPEEKLHAKLILVDGQKLIIGSSNWTEKAFNENHESNVMVDLEEDKDKIEILRINYADKLLEAIAKAQSNLDIVMYSFEFRDEEGNKNYDLMSALLAAYDRGVDIRIVFDSWSGTGESGNEPAYELLEQVGAQVYYDLDTVASHNKLVIVDNETVFLGSANWTESGLTKNREASILIRDIQTSRAYKAYVDELVKGLPGETKPRVPIPLSFLKEGGIFRQLYIKGGIESLRLYTWLIWEAFNRGTFTLERDYKRWYGAIYAEPVLPWSVNKSRRISTLVQYLEKTGAIVKVKGCFIASGR